MKATHWIFHQFLDVTLSLRTGWTRSVRADGWARSLDEPAEERSQHDADQAEDEEDKDDAEEEGQKAHQIKPSGCGAVEGS